MDDKTVHIFLSGAHSTGKTTIVNDLLQVVNIKPQLDVARTIMNQQGLSREQIDWKTQPANFEKLQIDILRRLYEISQLDSDVICDRGIDPIIYCSVYLGEQEVQRVLAEDFVKKFVERLRHSELFVVSPHPECVADDGVRMKPAMEELVRFTEVTCRTLDHLGVPFHRIDVLDRHQRVKQIVDVIKQQKPSLVK